jgi:hypothetical protein
MCSSKVVEIYAKVEQWSDVRCRLKLHDGTCFKIVSCKAEIEDAIAKNCRPRLYKEVLCVGCCCCPSI